MFTWEKERDFNNSARDNSANREKQAAWAARHPEQVKEKDAKRRTENPDYWREWRAKNPDKVKAISVRQNQTEKRKEYMREYMRKRRAAEKAKKEAESND